MKQSWMESKTMFTLFSCSSWVVVALVLFVLSSAALSLHGNFVLTPMGNRVFEVFLYTIAILFILAIVIIFFGMAFFCVLRGRSSVSGKILWFVFFFFTGPLGSTFYYFAVYRRLVRTQYEVEHA